MRAKNKDECKIVNVPRAYDAPPLAIAVRARQERRRSTYVESSFSRKRQHDDGPAARSRLVASKQVNKQALHPPHH